MKTVSIIGGGAAGMMAAAALAESGSGCFRIVIFEKNNRLGSKIMISGGGRCNLTTGISDVPIVLENYPRGARFLMSAMYQFPPEKVTSWFRARGVALKTEKDLRVFPVSDSGKDIVAALEKYLIENGVEIIKNAQVSKASKKYEKFEVELKDGKKYESDFLIIAVGGNSYQKTGGAGDGYAFARAFGHSITPLAPSLNSFLVSQPWISRVAGVAFERASFSLQAAGRKLVYEKAGPFLFTHRGVTGPAVFALSALAAYEDFSNDKPGALQINFFPDKTNEELNDYFREMIGRNAKKLVSNFIDLFLPKSLCAVFVEILKFDRELKVGNLNKLQREKILQLMQKFPLTVVGRAAGEEFVTAGGVDIREVNTNTMESKICPGLYFAGEVLDIDGFTGGFNLQAAWATGRLAGEKIKMTM